MDKTQLTLAFIGSAAIGALVSSLVAEIGKWRERKSRREELLLKEAVRMGKINMDVALEIARAGGRATTIVPLIEMTASYHRFLKHLLDTGKLPDDFVPAAE